MMITTAFTGGSSLGLASLHQYRGGAAGAVATLTAPRVTGVTTL